MTKSHLIKELAQKKNLTFKQSEVIINTIIECLSKVLVENGRIEFRGFGSFSVRHYKPYTGRNPKTGIVFQVKSKKLPRFKAGKELKEKIHSCFPL